MNEWAQTCAAVLTSTVAAEADKAQCRELMKHHQEFGWPAAFVLAAFFLAGAWGFRRVIRAIG